MLENVLALFYGHITKCLRGWPEVIKIDLKMGSQPDYTSCGPTSLLAIYNFYGDRVTSEELLKTIPQFEEGGGVFGVMLGIDALKRGYKVLLYSFNLNIFDPTWFELPMNDIKNKLKQMLELRKMEPKRYNAVKSAVEFIELGGEFRFQDLTTELISSYLSKDTPLLSGLSSTWLYRSTREEPLSNEDDDIQGEPAGHFVVLHGKSSDNKFVYVADPYRPNPISGTNYYKVSMDSLINSILLGVMSYDGNLIVIEPGK